MLREVIEWYETAWHAEREQAEKAKEAFVPGRVWGVRSYRELGDDAECSKTAAYKAMVRLERLGYVETQPGDGHGHGWATAFRPTQRLLDFLAEVWEAKPRGAELRQAVAAFRQRNDVASDLPFTPGHDPCPSGNDVVPPRTRHRSAQDTSFSNTTNTRQGPNDTRTTVACAASPSPEEEQEEDLGRDGPGDDGATSGGGDAFGEEGPAGRRNGHAQDRGNGVSGNGVSGNEQAQQDVVAAMQEAWQSAHERADLGKVPSWRGPELVHVRRLATTLAEVGLDPAEVLAHVVPRWDQFVGAVGGARGWTTHKGPSLPDVEFMVKDKHVHALVHWARKAPEREAHEADGWW